MLFSKLGDAGKFVADGAVKGVKGAAKGVAKGAELVANEILRNK